MGTKKRSLLLETLYTLLFLLSLTGSASAVALAQVRCGVQAGGALCPSNLCCSQWGYCGETSEYCGTGCQSQCCQCCRTPCCGQQAGGRLCAGPACCSQYGYCGTTRDYCGTGCQSQCYYGLLSSLLPPSPLPPSCDEAEGELTDIINEELFNQMLLHRNDPICPAREFYTFDAFINATKHFPCFGTVGDEETRKRELASFLAQTSHETTGGWDTAPDGPFAWGYCFKANVGTTNPYCEPSEQWPCVAGKKYYGRGPMQLSYNYNYGHVGEALGFNLLSDPDLVETDPTVSFKTALWFWMTAQPPKPSSHAVTIGKWRPTPADEAGGRVAGYGLHTNIINGGLECNITSPDLRVEDRIGFYKRYCDIFGISYGENLDCYNQRPFNWGSSWSIM